MYIETHAHLDFDRFDEDRGAVIARAKDSGIDTIITVGANMAGSLKALEIAQKYDFIYATLGIHPHDALEATDANIAKLKELGKDKKIVAIGECGLDFFKNYTPREAQMAAFLKQIELSNVLNLPLIIHARDAGEECLAVLKEEGVGQAVFHCFSGDLELAKKIWDKGFYTSFTGSITYSNSDKIYEVIRNVPEELFMIETDCPFLAPQEYRGKRNEPMYVIEVAKKIAEIRGMPLEKVAEISTKNAERFFSL